MAKWPLIGRSQELSRLTGAIFGRRGAVITGPPGVGKTTMAMMGVELAEDQGISVVRVAGSQVWQSLPFGAFACLLPPDPGGVEHGPEGFVELLRQYAQALVDSAGGSPLLVCVDDAHLLDDASAMLVHQLAQSRSATVLATVLAAGRGGQSAPGPIVSLWKDHLAERIEVAPLDDSLIEQLLEKVLGGAVDQAASRQFADRSLGNPLFLRELVAGAFESGALSNVTGSWRLPEGLRPTDRLVELVTLRLGDLNDSERHVLELTALGEPLSQATLDQLADPEAVESLENKGLISSRVDGRRLRIFLAHPIYGDVVKVGISARRERVLARSLAEATGGRRKEDTLQQASLRLVSGGGSAELLLAGAKAARVRHDHSLTERLARAAIDKGDRFEARFLAAKTAHVRGRPEQADRELAALAADAVSESEKGRVALLRFDNAFNFRGQADSHVIDELLKVVVDPILHDELLARRVRMKSVGSGPRAALEAASAWLEHPSAASPSTLHTMIGHSLTRLGRLDEALGFFNALPGSNENPMGDNGGVQWSLFLNRCHILGLKGRLTEAEVLLNSVHREGEDLPADRSAMMGASLAALYLLQGRVQSAHLQARSSYIHFRDLGSPFAARWSYGAAALALALAGMSEKATEVLTDLDALHLPANLLIETDILLARGWTAVAVGDLSTGRQYLESAVDMGQEVGDLIGATRALLSLARLGRARQVTSRLTALAGEIDSDLVANWARFSSAFATRSCGALEAVASKLEGEGSFLLSAEALGEAAVLLRRDGYSQEAWNAEQKGRRLLARCEGAVTPLVHAIGARGHLTSAEWETAMYAVAGSSDKEIANQMNLSVRTIENRLHRTYQKLGLTRRHELADALRDIPKV